MILDTSFLIDLLRGEESVEEVTDISASSTFFVTPVSVMELYEGVCLAASAGERREVERLLDGLRELEFTNAAAKRAGEVNAELHEDGQPIDVEDVMIAAVALENDESVVTRNTDHFDRIEGLETVTY
jgi:predicted nucleic acid-binding protein